MLSGEAWIAYGNAHRIEVERDLIERLFDYFVPALLVAVRVIDNHEEDILGVQFGNIAMALCLNTIMLFEPPYCLFESSMGCPRGTRKEHLGVEFIDKGRMQAILCLGTQKML